MKRLYLILFILSFTFHNSVKADNFTRNWNFHLSNIQTFDVVRGEKRVYFLSEGSIYYYNQVDNSINTITKIEGLSGSDFKDMDYSFDTRSLIVIYKNSMIDIIPDDGAPIPVAAIYEKSMSGDKTIYSVTCHEGLCYLACGFGIVVLDIAKQEIKDSFIIGDYGNYQPVYDVALNDEYIYAGTPNGIKYARLDAPNLLDFSYWAYVENKVLEDYNYNVLTYGSDRIWAIHYGDESQWHGDRLFSQHSLETWFREYSEVELVNSVKIHGNDIALTGENHESEHLVAVYRKNEGLLHYITEYPFMEDSLEIDPRSAMIDGEGTVWIADYNYGGIRYKDGVFDQLAPSGPIDNDAFSLSFSNGKLWVAKGGLDSKWDGNDSRFLLQSYSDGKWDYINRYSNLELEEYRDVVQVLPSLDDPNHIYVATWGDGILEFKNGELIKVYNEKDTKCTLQGIGDSGVRIGGMDFDSRGNLWVTNSEVQDVLHMKTPGGEWQSFNLPEIATGYKIGKVLVTSQDQIWIQVPRDKTNGLYIMDINDGSTLSLEVERRFTNTEDTDDQVMNNVYDIVEDNDGDIWVATSLGVAVYTRPEDIFDEEEVFATQPAVDVNDGLYHPLLQGKAVTSIAIDGANQKWFGTRTSGLYLMSADGTDELDHFTTETDLISDKILSLTYDDEGTLYIGTDLGLVSFHTESKKPSANFDEVYAYPNPVRRAIYQGDIYITGLMINSNVKITNVSGDLVYETTSLGGQAVWDGKDLAGNVVHTGVYLVFCASEDGNESAVTKIAFVR